MARRKKGKRKRSAAFQVQDILPLALTIVVAGIGLAYGLSVVGDVKNDMGPDSCADNPPASGYTTYVESTGLCTNGSLSLSPVDGYFNATSDTITATAKFPDKLGLIVTVIVAAILIGILVRYLMMR